MTAYRYDGTFAGFLTCVWDALESLSLIHI